MKKNNIKIICLATALNFQINPSQAAVSNTDQPILPPGFCAVVIASEPTLEDVQLWIKSNPDFLVSGVFKGNTEYFAITGGIIEINGWEKQVLSLVSRGVVPKGSFCSAKGIVEAVSPYDFLPNINREDLATPAYSTAYSRPAGDEDESGYVDSLEQHAQMKREEQEGNVVMEEQKIAQAQAAQEALLPLTKDDLNLTSSEIERSRAAVGECYKSETFNDFVTCLRTSNMPDAARYIGISDYAMLLNEKFNQTPRLGSAAEEVSQGCLLGLASFAGGDERMLLNFNTFCVYYTLREKLE